MGAAEDAHLVVEAAVDESVEDFAAAFDDDALHLAFKELAEGLFDGRGVEMQPVWGDIGEAVAAVEDNGSGWGPR